MGDQVWSTRSVITIASENTSANRTALRLTEWSPTPTAPSSSPTRPPDRRHTATSPSNSRSHYASPEMPDPSLPWTPVVDPELLARVDDATSQ